jgi:GPH family glycoside/pentoside/hexuronide:cation symporter
MMGLDGGGASNVTGFLFGGRSDYNETTVTDAADPGGQASAPADIARRQRLPLRLKIGYGAGQLVDGVTTNGINVFLLFYLTAVCGIPGNVAGLALAAGLIIDALMDPFIGSLSDGWRSRLGRRLPFMLASLVPLAASFMLIFSLPSGLSASVLFVWLAVLSLTLRLSFSLFMLPYQAIGAEVSESYDERSGIMAWRWGFGIVGALITVVLGFGIFFAGPNGLSNRAAYLPFAASAALVFVAGALVACRTAAATLDRQHSPPAEQERMRSRIVGEALEIFRNPSFRILAAGALLLFTSLAINTALGLHTYTFFWKLGTAQTQTVTLATFLGLLIGAPLAGPLLKRLEKRSVMLFGIFGLAAVQAGPPALRLLGALPFTGNSLVILLSFVTFLAGTMMTAAAIAFFSMLADCADEHEHLFGARREGLYFAGWSVAGKIAAGAGTLIAGATLSAIGFPTDLARHPDMHIVLAPASSNWLGFVYGPVSALLTLAALAVTSRYRLDRSRHAAIISELDERRAAAAALAAHT